MKVLFGAVIGLFISTSAFAGWSSGGSNALVCFDKNPEIVKEINLPKEKNSTAGQIRNEYLNKITRIENFDLYEAKLEKGDGTKPQLIQVLENETPNEYVKRMADRFEHAYPPIAQMLRDGLTKFTPEHIYLRNHPLYKIDDAKEVGPADSKNCVLATIARQEDLNGTNLLHIDKRLFNLNEGYTRLPTHSDLSKAVTMLHENVYWTARSKSQHKNSKLTRLQVALIIRSDLTLDKIIELSKQYGITKYYENSGSIAINPGEDFSYVNQQVREYFDVLGKSGHEAFEKFEETRASEKSIVAEVDRLLRWLLERFGPKLSCNNFELCLKNIQRLVDIKDWEELKDSEGNYRVPVHYVYGSWGSGQKTDFKTKRDPSKEVARFKRWLVWLKRRIAERGQKRKDALDKEIHLTYHEKVRDKLFAIPYLSQERHLDLEKRVLKQVDKMLDATLNYSPKRMKDAMLNVNTKLWGGRGGDDGWSAFEKPKLDYLIPEIPVKPDTENKKDTNE